jgi:YggT family protein
MALIGELLILALTVFLWIIIIQVVLSWLIAFGVVNIKNEQAKNIVNLLNKITDPVYKPLRKFIPAIGGIDITPIAIILAINVLRSLIASIFIY